MSFPEATPGEFSASAGGPSTEEASESRLRRDLSASTWDGASYSVMVGIGENYIGAFALALQLGAVASGLIITLPMFLGSVLQLMTPWAVRKVGSHRTWVVAGVAVQTVCLLVLPLAALFAGTWPAALIAFAAVSLYWASGLTGGPPWNTWMEELVPTRIRTRFFACRARICQICLLTGFVIGGSMLEFGKGHELVLSMFAAIFVIAAAARFVSGYSLSRQSEPSRGKLEEQSVSWREFFSAGGSASGGRLVVYLLAMQIAAQIAGPYFTPFMLEEEGMNYRTYMILIGCGFLGKVLALPFWGRVGKRIGANRLLRIGGAAIIPLAAFWIFADLFHGWTLTIPLGTARFTLRGEEICIGCIQLCSGAAWAAYELAMTLMFFHGIPRSHRTSMLTWFNLGNSAAMLAGGLIGAAILQSFGKTHGAYLIVFGVSSVARMFTLALLARLPHDAPAR